MRAVGISFKAKINRIRLGKVAVGVEGEEKWTEGFGNSVGHSREGRGVRTESHNWMVLELGWGLSFWLSPVPIQLH